MRDERPGARPPDVPTPDIAGPDDDPAEPGSGGAEPASVGAHDGLTDDYELLDELGREGTAIVYLARDRSADREVVLKVLRAPAESSGVRDAEAVARIHREARAIAQLEHPHIARVQAVRELPDGVALELPYVAGRTLAQVVADEGPLEPPRAVRILRELASALAFAHARGVLHRDVRPENVVVDDATGHAQLADFGVARWEDALAGPGRASAPIEVAAYASPEQLKGRPLDARSDVHGLGLVGWEMLTGQRPWADADSPDVMRRHQLYDELPPIEVVRPADRPPVSPTLQYMIERMLQESPDARWADADVVVAQLTHPAPPADFAPWRRRHARRVAQARRGPAGAAPGPRERAAEALAALRDAGGRLAASLQARRHREPAAARAWAAPASRWHATRARVAVAGATATMALAIALAVRSTGSSEEAPPLPPPETARGEVVAPSAPPAPAALEAPPHLGITRAHGPSSLDRAFEWAPAVGPRVAALAAAAAPGPTAPQTRTDGGAKSQPPATVATGQAERPAAARATTRTGRGTRAAASALHVHAPVTISAPEGAPSAAASSPTFAATARDAVWRVAARVRSVTGGEPVPVGAGGAANLREVVPDSALARAPRRSELVGSWDHGDRRSRLGDSLTLVLREDGTAHEVRRRYSLDQRNRWLLQREQRDGLWEIRYGGLTQVELCVTWAGVRPVTTCAGAVPDSVDGGRMLTYAGRHWRARPAGAEPLEKRPAGKRRPGGRRG